jgi:hypothetical protein
VGVEGRPVHRFIAGAAGPCGVPAAMPEAGLMAYQHSVRAERVHVGAAGGWLGYPLPFGRSDELTLHL